MVLAFSSSCSEESAGFAESSFLPEGAATIASVMPSDKMFKHKTVAMIAKPGYSACHHRPAKTPPCASDKIFPHDGMGSCSPAPINVNDASKIIASATII